MENTVKNSRILCVLGSVALICTLSACDDIKDVFKDDPTFAYADLYNSLGTTESIPVRGRIVMEKAKLNPDEATPFGEIAQDEVENTAVQLELVSGEKKYDLGEISTDDEGYFDSQVSLAGLGIEPGEWVLVASVNTLPAGEAHVRILGGDHTGILIRSDVDLTYLNTDFLSSTAKLKLLGQSAADRETLPAMEVVYKSLRDGEDDRPTVFLSGSPRFFKRILDGKMKLDQVKQEGIVLKPYKDIANANLASLDLSQIVPELKEQVGYKLYWVMRLRLEAPPSAPEILMGDDSEADIVVYVLYHRFMTGELDPAGLLAELDKVKVSPSWRDLVAGVAPQVKAHMNGAASPVLAIYINKTGLDSAHFPVADWSVDGVTRYHQGAWPLALDLYQSGWLTKDHVNAVKSTLTGSGQSADDLKAASDHGEAQGYLKSETVGEFK
jgi:hypothetical protein